jgi:hypothetical protein
LGGSWAYFKFIRGRTFAHRAELDVTASLEGETGRMLICAVITLRNAGLSRLPLNSKMKAVRLLGAVMDHDGRAGAVSWERIVTLPILDQHDWLEAQETVTDTVVYSLQGGTGPSKPYPAYRIEAIVGSRMRKLMRKGTQWRSRTVVFSSSGNTAKRKPLKFSRPAQSSPEGSREDNTELAKERYHDE